MEQQPHFSERVDIKIQEDSPPTPFEFETRPKNALDSPEETFMRFYFPDHKITGTC